MGLTGEAEEITKLTGRPRSGALSTRAQEGQAEDSIHTANRPGGL
jgi:hypothetical protein